MRGHRHGNAISWHPRQAARSNPSIFRRFGVSVAALALLSGVMAQGTPFASAGRVFYVSTTGADANVGTLIAPFRTIAHGLGVLAPGDTLYVRGGIYSERVAPLITGGRSDAPVLVSAYPGESPLILGSLTLWYPSYWTIRGINVLGPDWSSGKSLVRFRGGKRWRFESSDVRRGHTSAGVLVTGGASHFTLRDVSVHDMFGSGSGPADLIRIESGSGGIIERSLLIGSPLGAGVKLGSASSGVSDTIVRYNTMYANLGPSNVVLTGLSSGNRIERNIMSLPAAGSPNVTTTSLVGTNNQILSNIGWGSTSLLQRIAGLLDRGGNLAIDPRFVDTTNRDFHTLAPVAAAFGRFGIAADASPPTVPPVATPTASVVPTVAPPPLPSPSPTVKPPPPPPAPPPPPPITVPSGRLYASSSFWNTQIASGAAVDADSASMVQGALVAYRSNSNFANTDGWGIPVVYARSTDKTYDVGCTKYDCGTHVSFQIPAGVKPTTGSDHHLVVIDGDRELDMWGAVYDSSADTWSASSRYVTSSTGWGAMCALGQHCNGSVAAGFAAAGGIPRPEDFSGDVIAHALTITTPLTRSGMIACPATHTDGKSSSASALPEGARVQLDPSFNVSSQSWPHWKKVIARTLQVYGAYVSDTGGTLAIRGEADLNRQGAWADAGVPEGANLSDLPWEHLRVLDVKAC